MTLSSLPRIEQQAPAIEAEINYLQPGPAINRRFVSRGVEVNTGSFGPHRVTVRDGRDLRDQFTLSSHGFALVDAPTSTIPPRSTQSTRARSSRPYVRSPAHPMSP
jgi:hypothetical protein